ncbi:MAG TPA: D-alanine--D-alanine ligase family protein [Terriglobia bacterium]|nr:D-alanine--D-alanine ligase family protein [Terriglobia bacterium]
MKSKKIRIAILFGGRSGEHEVSLQSAASVLAAIDRKQYDVLPIGITKEGRWVTGNVPETLPAEKLAGILRQGNPVIASADPQGPSLIPLNSSVPTGRNLAGKIDVVFPLLHGTFGEDGTVQGLLDLAGIPYVGAGVLASAAGMDKDIMKRLFRDSRIPVIEWITVLRNEWQSYPALVRQNVQHEIGYPAFVKPANLGSSVGISKVHHAKELPAALNLAARYDRKILIEKAVNAREIECAVLGNDQPEASVPGEIEPVNEFYDYEAKYIREGSKLLIPAPLPQRQAQRIRQLALQAFKAIDCAGMARVDFLLDRKTGHIFVNEINTIPGFTSISMYPKLWEASGIPFPELVDRLIRLALERHAEKNRTKYTHSGH